MAFLARTEAAKHSGTYVSPHAGRVLFSEHAGEWMTARRTADTTTARDRSVMRTHVLPQWGAWPLSRVDEMAVQKWITDLAGRRSHAVVSKSLQLTSGVFRSAVRNRLIAVNPCDGVRVQAARKRDTDDLIISRAELRDVLLPVVPDTAPRIGGDGGRCRPAVGRGRRAVLGRRGPGPGAVDSFSAR